MSGKVTESPLKQVNVPGASRGPLKFETSWNELLSANGNGESDQLKNKTAKQLDKHFLELFCLDVDEQYIFDRIHELPTAQLLGPLEFNVSSFFCAAVKTIKEVDKRDTRRHHAVQSLVPFLKSVLGRKYDNFNYDVMSLLAGHIDRADTLFADLISSIDMILQADDFPLVLRHRTLQLAIVIVASVNNGSLTSYFLRRDLFSTLTNFIVDEDSSKYAFESAVLIGMLANYRKFETRNPYLVRIEDLVDDNVMLSILDTASACATTCRDHYTRLTPDDASASFVASLTSLMSAIDIRGLWSLDFSLPPRPPSRKGKEKATEVEPLSTPSKANGHPAAAQRPNEANAQFARLPNELIIILLPFYDMLYSNKAFGSLACSDASDAFLAPSLISLSSYVFTHATTSARGKVYARFCLTCLDLLLQECEAKLIEEEDEVRLCRQRQPMMPGTSGDRPLILALLDACVMYIRYNIQKRLEVDSYISALRTLRRVMEALRMHRSSPRYEWTTVWRTLMTLSAFIITRRSDMSHPRLDELMSQILLTLAYAIYWSQAFLPSIDAHVSMYYEILHGEPALAGLADLLGVSLDTPNPDAPAAKDETSNGLKTPTKANGSSSRPSPISPRYSSSNLTQTNGLRLSGASGRNGKRRMSTRAIAADSWNILHTVIRFFLDKIEQARLNAGKAAPSTPARKVQSESQGAGAGAGAGETDERKVDQDELEAEDVLNIIGAHVGGPDLIDSDAVAEVERYDERENEAFLKQLLEVVCQDTLKLVPVKSPF